jgi:phospholipid/cholesterol/gamma-HCH transport system substrate-binding protein
MKHQERTFPTAFAERNKIVTALIGLVVLVVIFTVTFSAQSLPIIGGGTTYRAEFAEAGGLTEGNEVRVSGVKVGEVTGITLDRGTVEVAFRAKGPRLGNQTSAAVKVKTLLGQKFLALTPSGRGELDGPIPLDRTTTPYDVNQAFSDLSTSIGAIDTPQLEESFDVLSDAFRDTPDSVQTLVTGLTDLSRTISSRDDQLADLLAATRDVSGTLKDRNAEFSKLITDGNALLTELSQRRQAVGDMLAGTARLGTQLRGLVQDNQKRLEPALDRLDEVSRILRENQDELDDALRALGPYYRVVTATTGNGPFIDAYLCGLIGSDGRPVLDADVVRDCQPKKGGGR